MAAANFPPPSHLFERNISLNDLDSALNVREVVRKDVVVPEEATKHRHLGPSTSYSLVLPSFQTLHEEFRKFVFSFLVDGHILRELENARRLNWCSSLCRMVTVNTLGDGNCLMHAASIGMWAVNDRYQTLRKTVYEALVEDVEGFYLNRWKSEEQHQMLNQIGGYERTEQQWAHEWEEVIRHISQNEFPLGPNGAQFGSLEEIHIFVLANILRRTIIVLSDEILRGHYGDSYAPINFGGIYLPLLWDSVDCVKSPLVIGYADGHFTAVVSIEDGKLDLGIESQSAVTSSSCMHAVPLVKYDGTPMPVHFLYDHEVPLASGHLRQYLDCAKVSFAGNPGDPRQPILVAKLHFVETPRCMKDLVEGYFTKAREEYQRVSRSRQLSPQFQPGAQLPALQIVQCQTQGCDFYGSTETGNRCSKCLNEYLRSLGPACKPSPHVSLRQIPTGQQQNPPNTGTRVTTSMNLPLANSVKCRTTGCKYGAVPNRSGLCERCFEAERSAEELAASISPMNLATARHCANQVNGCKFFGLPERHDLCSRCYRTFCLSMENTLGLSSPTGLPPSSPPAAVANHCQTQGCQFPGVPALYGMCVQCYTGCIHSFITSEGRSVGTVTQASPNLPPSPPLLSVPKKTLPTGAVKKGVLCASPGCFNEGVFQLGDLCTECYNRKSGPSPQMRISPVSVPATAATVNFPVTQPPPSTVSATATVATTHHLTSALTSAISHHLCSNPTCFNQTGKEEKSLCPRCEHWITSVQCVLPMPSSNQPRRPVGAIITANSAGASMPPAQMTTVNMGAYTTPVSSSSQQVKTSHEIAATTTFQNPSAEVPAGPCAMGCGKPSAQDSGLCVQCYATAFELELNRQPVPQPSRQVQGATASSISSNQVEQRNTNIQGNPSGSLQQTETSAAAKKPLLPCTSTGCMRFGTQEKNGLCESCFRKKGTSQSSDTASQGNQPQASSNNNSLYTARATEQNRQLTGSPLPASHALKEPVQVCQSSQYGSGVRRHDSNSGNVEENVSGQRCRGTNCTLFGTPETNGYCFRCFLESTIPQSGPSSIPDFPTEASSLSIPSDRSLPGHCQVTGCNNLAAPERHGHCENCFKRFYPEVMNRERFAQRQLSELTERNN